MRKYSFSAFLQASQAVLVAKKPACQCRRYEIQVQSLGQEDSLEEGMATHSSIHAWRNPMDSGAWQATARGIARVGHNLVTTQEQ